MRHSRLQVHGHGRGPYPGTYPPLFVGRRDAGFDLAAGRRLLHLRGAGQPGRCDLRRNLLPRRNGLHGRFGPAFRRAGGVPYRQYDRRGGVRRDGALALQGGAVDQRGARRALQPAGGGERRGDLSPLRGEQTRLFHPARGRGGVQLAFPRRRHQARRRYGNRGDEGRHETHFDRSGHALPAALQIFARSGRFAHVRDFGRHQRR